MKTWRDNLHSKRIARKLSIRFRDVHLASRRGQDNSATRSQGVNSFISFLVDVFGEGSRQALPFRSSQRLAHVHGAPHPQDATVPSLTSFPSAKLRGSLPGNCSRSFVLNPAALIPSTISRSASSSPVRHPLRRPQACPRLRRFKPFPYDSSQLPQTPRDSHRLAPPATRPFLHTDLSLRLQGRLAQGAACRHDS